jgi:hypothetical protein
MMRHRFTTFLIVAFLAALVAFPAGRLTAPKPPARPPVCPYGQACPYCKGREALDAGAPLAGNPFPDVEGAAEPRRRWNQGWLDGQRTKPALQADE